jgi:parallel beta-helix repeat protein
VHIQPLSDGNTLYVGGSGPGNYTKIQDAIDNASDEDTIFVFEGIYFEILTIDKKINLLGENNTNTVIDGFQRNTIITVSENDVLIKGFTIQNSSDTGISVSNYNNFIMENNIIYNTDEYGIYLINSTNSSIIDNKFVYIGEGISGDENSNTIIDGNVCVDCGVGIWFFHSNNFVISNNSIKSEGTYPSVGGIWTSGKNYIICNNDIFYCEEGIALATQTIFAEVFGNTITLSIFGITCEGTILSSIHDNNIILSIRKAIMVISALNKWQNNYWGRPRFLPKLIMNRMPFGGGPLAIIPFLFFPFFRFDFFPRKVPYQTGR